jgi:hypothetical protein
MVAQAESHTLVSPLITLECYTLTITRHQPKLQGTSQPYVRTCADHTHQLMQHH